jgi:two-component system, NtrC family, sensor kinase
MMKFWKRSLMVQMVGYFLLLSFVTVSSICLIAFLQSRAALQHAIMTQLSLTANLKEDELDRWVNDQAEEVRTLIKTPEVQALAVSLIQNRIAEQDKKHLLGMFSAIAVQHSSLDEILIVGNTGEVVLSTEQSRQGSYEATVQYSYLPSEALDESQNESLVFQPTSQDVSQDLQQFSPNFYPDPITGKPCMTFAAAISDATGQQVGTLAMKFCVNVLAWGRQAKLTWWAIRCPTREGR